MLPKKNRLNLKTDFKWVAQGKKSEDLLLKLFYRTGDPGFPRIGIALSAKTFKLAVERNRARRLTSKAFENLIDQLPANINIVVMPKQGVLKISSDDLTERLKKQLDKLDQ